MIASVHLADVGPATALRLLRENLDPDTVQGLSYAQVTATAPLGGQLLPRPNPGRVGLIATWQDDSALDRFLDTHPLARRLAHGWWARLQPTHVFGHWPGMADLLASEQPMDAHEQVAVLTIGRLRLTQTLRFLRASAAAEQLALRDPALLHSTGLARPRALLCTFSVWQSTAAMRAYAGGASEPAHAAASRAHAARPFHHESAFIRFRPYSVEGSWDSSEASATLAALGSS
jgi:hypothetical protein